MPPNTVPLEEFTVLTDLELPNEPLPAHFGNPIDFIIQELESDVGLLDSCRVPYVAVNATRNSCPGRAVNAYRQHPDAKHVRMIECTSDVSIKIGYGHHNTPSIDGNSNTKHLSPDIFFEDTGHADWDWNNVLPVIEGFVRQPVHVGNRTFALNSTKYCAVANSGTVQTAILDFNPLGEIECVPFEQCERVSSDTRDLIIPSHIDIDGKSILAVVQGRVLPPVRCCVTGRMVHVNLNGKEVASRHVADKTSMGALTFQQNVYLPTYEDSQFISSDEFIETSFFVIVDTPNMYSANSPLGVRLGRYDFICDGKLTGILQNRSTDKLCHVLIERANETQRHILKAGSKYHTMNCSGLITDQVYLEVMDSAEDILTDIDMAEHELYDIFTIGDN